MRWGWAHKARAVLPFVSSAGDGRQGHGQDKSIDRWAHSCFLHWGDCCNQRFLWELHGKRPCCNHSCWATDLGCNAISRVRNENRGLENYRIVGQQGTSRCVDIDWRFRFEAPDDVTTNSADLAEGPEPWLCRGAVEKELCCIIWKWFDLSACESCIGCGVWCCKLLSCETRQQHT